FHGGPGFPGAGAGYDHRSTMDGDTAQKRLTWAEALFNTGGQGNLELAVQDMKLLVRDSLAAWKKGGAAPLDAQEALKLLGDLDHLARSGATAQQFFGVQAGIAAFVKRAP